MKHVVKTIEFIGMLIMKIVAWPLLALSSLFISIVVLVVGSAIFHALKQLLFSSVL